MLRPLDPGFTKRGSVQLLAVPGCTRRRFGFGALFYWPRRRAEAKRAVDQTDAAVGLRKIAQHPATSRIKLLSEQADVITVRHEAIEQLARFRIAPRRM